MGSTDNGARKVDRGEISLASPVRRDADGVWQVRGYAAARTVLRSTDTRQAGLGIETVENLPAKIRRPVLFRDGAEHREHRRQTARYFTRRHVDENYRALMVRVADGLIDQLRRDGHADVSQLSFRLAIDVTAAVLGLTNSHPGLDRRLERFFPERFGTPGFTSLTGLYWFMRQIRNWMSVYFGDVRPAVRVRRRARRDDLISHLIDEGCSNSEILGECLTYAAAGMVTTREFVSLAAWHLFTDDDLRNQYLAADEAGRIAVLHELLRLEPVIGNLRRRTTAAVEIPGDAVDASAAGDGGVVIPSGELVDIAVSVANLDPAAVGPKSASVCPARPAGDAVSPAGLSFGDGPHRCPGAHIAILETDIFLTRLFGCNGLRMTSPPRVSIKVDIAAYDLRGLTVAMDRDQPTA